MSEPEQPPRVVDLPLPGSGLISDIEDGLAERAQLKTRWCECAPAA